MIPATKSIFSDVIEAKIVKQTAVGKSQFEFISPRLCEDF